MTRAPFIVIDGKLYRWKDILELRRAQLAARRSRTSKPDGVICNLARRSPPARRAHGIRALSATGPVCRISIDRVRARASSGLSLRQRGSENPHRGAIP